MAPPEVGDLVAVLDVGAYGFTESMPLFLSHPIPAEIAVRGGDAWVVAARASIPDVWLGWQTGSGFRTGGLAARRANTLYCASQ